MKLHKTLLGLVTVVALALAAGASDVVARQDLRHDVPELSIAAMTDSATIGRERPRAARGRQTVSAARIARRARRGEFP